MLEKDKIAESSIESNKEKLFLNEVLDWLNESIFNGEMDDIIELTYAYTNLWDWKFLNRTLFEDFIWEKFDGQNIEHLWYLAWHKLNYKKNIINNYQESLKDKNVFSWEKIEILKWTLDFIENIILFTLEWLIFEKEKAWWNCWILEHEKRNKIKKMEELEWKLYWWKICENKEEVIVCYEKLLELLEKNKDQINEEEVGIFREYLKQLKEEFPYLDEENEENEENKKNEENEENEMMDKQISRKNYVKIFEIIFEIYWIEKKVVVDERSSIYDGPDSLCIPNLEKYNTLKLKRILELIVHEIEVHFIVEKNNKQNLWDFRGWANLQREEWTASLSEDILSWYDWKKTWINFRFSQILMWEILDWDDFNKFVEIFLKLQWERLSVKNSHILRKKRNYPLYLKWVQHKDTSYSRWKMKVVKFLEEWWNIEDLFLGKVSFDDLDKVKKIVSKSWNAQNYPFLLWEILKFVLDGKKLTHKSFTFYIKEKYSFLDVDKNFKKGNVKKITMDTKRKIIDILSLIKED